MLYSSSGFAFAVSDSRYFSSTPQVLITEMCPRTEKKFFQKNVYYFELDINNTGSLQSFTSLKADLHQDINKVIAISKCLNGTFS